MHCPSPAQTHVRPTLKVWAFARFKNTLSVLEKAPGLTLSHAVRGEVILPSPSVPAPSPLCGRGLGRGALLDGELTPAP